MPRRLIRLAALAGCALAVTVCGEQGRFGGGSTGPGGDDVAPVADILLPGGDADTVVDITDSLRFTARATDNVRVATVQVRVRGLGTFTAFDTTVMDSTISGTSTDVSKAFVVPLPANAAGQRIAITMNATDASQNAGSDSVTVRVEDPQPPALTVREPSSGIIVPAGGTVDVVARATDPSGILQMGARLFFRNALGQPVAITGDSTTYTPTIVTAKTDTFTVPIPDTLNPGSYTIHAFVMDNSPGQNDTVSGDVTIQVADTIRPTGLFVSPPQDTQIVAGDDVLIRFRAQDRTGVDSVVFRGFQLKGDSSLGTNQEILRFQPKTATIPGDDDTTVARVLLAVPADSTPSDSVFLEARVFDVGGNTATVLRRVRVVSGPFARVLSPLDGARVPVGVPLPVSVIARDPDSVRIIGFIAAGVAPGVDTITVIAAPLQVEDTVALTLTVPATTSLGPDTITPFGRDRLGNRVLGRPVVVSFQDTVVPVVTISQPAAAGFPVTVGDSVLVRVRVQDNRGVSTVTLSGLARRGVDSLGTAADVARYQAKTVTLPQHVDTTFSRFLLAVPGDSTSELANVIIEARDSSGNRGLDSVTVNIVNGPSVAILQPSAGALTSPGKQLVIQVRGVDPQGVRVLGWRASGVVTAQDSVIKSPVSGALADTAFFTDTLVVPLATALGTFTITPFGVDSLNAPSGTVGGIGVTVQSAAGDVTPPLVQFTTAARVEVDDSATVLATDASGIQRLGIIVRALGSATVVRADSVTISPSNQTNVTRTFQLTLDTISTFPRQVTIEAFAVDSVGNVGVSTFTGIPKATPADAETLTVVAGKTIGLPRGGSIGDAIYNPNRNELYLTNTLLNQLEIFQLTDSTFAPAIPVGATPVGIALWPRDTLGVNADTVVIANSGGANLSVVDVANRLERRRHRLPNYIVQTVKTAANPGGGTDIIITEFDFSDRPFHLGTVCGRVTGVTCDSVYAVYSTTPTGAQTNPPFANRGYVAWDALTAIAGSVNSGHFLHEVGFLGRDTVQIIAVRDTAPGFPARDTILGAGFGDIIDLPTLSFQDSTFVRNSGDFNHVLFGEGGLDQGFARAFTYDARAGRVADTSATCGLLVGFPLKCDRIFDRGVSEGIFLRDLLVNRAAKVTSIATNFNGRTNFVRADSIYAFDFTLKLTGMIQIGGTNPGMDLDPDHRFEANVRGTGGIGGTLNPDDRMLFTARPDANIDVFDTFFYGRVTSIPVRDPVIGPIRVAKLASGQQMLVGVTQSGVVVVRLPSTPNIFPIRFLPVAGSGTP